MVQRYTREFQAKTFLADILDTNDTRVEFMRRKGLLQPYYTPAAEKFDKRFLQPQGYWVANRATMIVMGYNTRLVKPSEAPQRYEDILDPKWKEKMALEREDSHWLMSLMEYWREEKGKAFFQRLRTQNPKVRTGHTLLAQLIAAGEDFLSPNAHNQGIASARRRGAPVAIRKFCPIHPVYERDSTLSPSIPSSTTIRSIITASYGTSGFYNRSAGQNGSPASLRSIASLGSA